ncbi:hypothetical protein AMEX_G18128 [Astyanax mexicanus]|uniref:Uncharacterized protein n=1 Tax=Astyanax mexicanus TaxID=7994 RepID=A0A8T2L6J7_ASTMX|nr:hypothetical protein AMEX_G18128 [Astyanax mexicanus]
MEETTSTGAMASTSTNIESALHLSTGVTSTAQATLIDEEDKMGEEDMGGTTSSGTMASTSTQIASPPHLSTGDTSTAQGLVGGPSRRSVVWPPNRSSPLDLHPPMTCMF